MSTTNYKNIIAQSFEILLEKEAYTQKTILNKLRQLEVKVSSSLISNLVRDKKNSAPNTLKRIAEGLQIILKKDFCLEYSRSNKAFTPIPGCLRQPVPLEPYELNPTDTQQQDYVIHDGRLNVSQKVALYEFAQEEIIEIGIRLRSFNSYFISKRESAFKEPILHQLEAGVNFKCYIIDPQAGILQRYIKDRSSINLTEKEVLEDAAKNAAALRKLFTDVNKAGYKGKIQLYHYNHFPYYHASVADGNTDQGLLYISPYLLGISRANSPVIELHKKRNKVLYRRYWQSVKTLIHSDKVRQIV